MNNSKQKQLVWWKWAIVFGVLSFLNHTLLFPWVKGEPNQFTAGTWQTEIIIAVISGLLFGAIMYLADRFARAKSGEL